MPKATDFYVSIQIAGTPDDCIQQVGEWWRPGWITVTEFSYGSMPSSGGANMRLPVDAVLPTLQRTRRLWDHRPAPLAVGEADRLFAPA